MHLKNAGATYIASNRLRTRPGSGVAKWTSSAVAAFLILIVMVSGLGLGSYVAYADNEDKNAAEESDKAAQDSKNALDALNPNLSEDEISSNYLFDEVGDYRPGQKINSFQGLLWSVFGIRYINSVPSAAAPVSTAGMASRLGVNGATYVCNTNQVGAGTAYYHNCDIPNLMTEFLQDAYSLFDTSGANGADVENAYAGNLLGIPKNLPGNGSVPVTADVRAQKYTGLELYGYSLPWTTYLGEWDHIKTQSEARLLSNFGFFDHISLSGAAIGNSIASGLDVAVDNFSSQLGSSGNIFAAVGGFFSGFAEGAASGGIATVLDTSDLNVVLSFAWYRVGYANTTYGLRQLTDAETAAIIRLTFLQMMAQSNPDAAGLSDAMLSVADAGKKPRKPISKCEVLSVKVDDDDKATTGSWSEYGKPTDAQMNDTEYTGVTKEDCRTQAQASAKKWNNADDHGTAPSGADAKVTADNFMKFDAEGNRKADTVATWKEWNSKVLTTASGLGIDCSSTYPNNSQLADEIWDAYIGCWGGSAPGGPGTGYTGGNPAGSVTSSYAWNKAANAEYEANQGNINTNWVADVLSAKMVQAFIQSNQDEMNFNAPWRRYVCLNPDGTDMMKTSAGLSQHVFAFTINGTVNPACNAEFRAPIQNGVFGNGYTGGTNQLPENDTRHISNFGNPISSVFLGQFTKAAQEGQNFLMGVGQFATMISSEVISWTYMPILDSLGITDIIVKLIESFRDSLFFPLAYMFVALGAIGVLWGAFRRQAYREGFVSVIMMCLVFVTGAFLMYKTDEVVNLTQDVPAMVEETIVGSIFSASGLGDDQLCSSTSAAVNSSGNIFGKMADTSGSQATRELICYNWRTFVFEPWVYGQFGAGFNELYSNGASNVPANGSTWENSNSSLVGNAGVNMGNGEVVENWALYQLDVLKSGTSTTADTSLANGRVDPNFYRIVDAQFGPNNGAGTEIRFQNAWSGSDLGPRNQIAFLSPVLAVFGAVVVISYSLTKLVITLLCTLMLVFLPFAFLLGLFPSKRPKLKDYLLSIVGMMIQRVVLILVLSIFFVLLLTFASAGEGNYFNIFLMGMLTCLVFWMWRKDIMGYVFSSIGNPQFGRQWREDPGAAMREWPLMKTAMQKADQLRDARMAIGSAAIGSVLSGRAPITASLKSGKLEFGGAITDELKSRRTLLMRKQRRREGFEGIRSGIMSAREVARETKASAQLDPETQEMLKDMFQGKDNGENTVTPEKDLAEQKQVYDMLKTTPGFREISVPVLKDGVEVKDNKGEIKFERVVIAENAPDEVIARQPEDEIDSYSRLMKPQDRRLASEYKTLGRESYGHHQNRLKIKERAMANPDSRSREIFEKYTQFDTIASVQQFSQETDLKKRATLAKTIDAKFKGELDEVLNQVDKEMSDKAGYTEGDRRKIRNLIKASVTETLEQEKIEHKMKRIQDHLEYVAQESYVASNNRVATKNAINDMNTKLKEAAEQMPPQDASDSTREEGQNG